MKYKIKAVVKSHPGLVRDINQDNYFFDGKILNENNRDKKIMQEITFNNTDGQYFGVFDGMGGEAHGEIASYLAALEMKNNFQDFKQYVTLANQKIVSEKKYKMGSTLAAISFHDKYYEICNVGDSKIFLYNSKRLKQISVDHTDEKMINNFNKREKPALTQHLGIKEDEITLNPYIDKINYTNCQILICSDGVTDILSNDDLTNILNSKKSIKEKLSLMEKRILDGGANDNFTIMLFEIEEVNKISRILKYSLGILVLLIFIIIGFIYFNEKRIIDKCDTLYVGESCQFKINDKHIIEIDDENIVSYEDYKIKANNKGSTIIRVKDQDKIVYEKKIVVFSK